MNNFSQAFNELYKALTTKPFTLSPPLQRFWPRWWVPMDNEMSSAARKGRAGFDRGQPATLESSTDAAKSLPDWISYDSKDDILSIHGRHYSAAMFGETGFLAPPGTLLRVEGRQPDCVTLVVAAEPTGQEPDYAWPTIADYEKNVGFTAPPGFTAAWNMARTKRSDLCLRAEDTTKGQP